MSLRIKTCDSTTLERSSPASQEVTLRPTIDVDCVYCSIVNKQRAVTLRKRIRISRALTRHVRGYRILQWSLIQVKEKCTKKGARQMSEDPSPYEVGYVFYCLKRGASF